MNIPELLYYEMGGGVTAFSTTRHGGYGQGRYGGLNVNPYCGDAPETVDRNRELLCTHLGIGADRLVLPHQVHGCEIRRIASGFFDLPMTARAQVFEGVDALMTDVPGICIGVSTADCIPIIIYDGEHHAACVVHAGWRGTVQRITRKAVLAMMTAYASRPERLQAVIGPGISCDSFEVGDEVYEQFASAAFPMEQVSRRMPLLGAPASSGPPVPGKPTTAPSAVSSCTGEELRWHIDLWACNRIQLQSVGIQPGSIHTAGICTYRHADDFFSARRLGTASGRMLTGIVIHGSGDGIPSKAR